MKNAIRQGREPSKRFCCLLISKTVDLDQVALAIEAGATAFGENRPDELLRKIFCLFLKVGTFYWQYSITSRFLILCFICHIHSGMQSASFKDR